MGVSTRTRRDEHDAPHHTLYLDEGTIFLSADYSSASYYGGDGDGPVNSRRAAVLVLLSELVKAGFDPVPFARAINAAVSRVSED